MSTIQNVKNLIRHGKQARLVTSHSEPTTDVPTFHAQQQAQPQDQFSRALGAFDTGKRGNGQAASQKPSETQLRRDHSMEIERLVAEEKENRSKMPKYPGLDRWILLEKMGDGAFSHVYRAKDYTSRYGEVAIKVVRKLETNSQVGDRLVFVSYFFCALRLSRLLVDAWSELVLSKWEHCRRNMLL